MMEWFRIIALLSMLALALGATPYDILSFDTSTIGPLIVEKDYIYALKSSRQSSSVNNQAVVAVSVANFSIKSTASIAASVNHDYVAVASYHDIKNRLFYICTEGYGSENQGILKYNYTDSSMEKLALVGNLSMEILSCTFEDTPAGLFIYARGDNQFMKINANTLQVNSTVPFENYFLAFLPSFVDAVHHYGYVYSLKSGRAITKIDLDKMAIVDHFSPPKDLPYIPHIFLAHPQSDRLFIGQKASKMAIFELSTQQPLKVLDLSPDGNLNTFRANMFVLDQGTKMLYVIASIADWTTSEFGAVYRVDLETYAVTRILMPSENPMVTQAGISGQSYVMDSTVNGSDPHIYFNCGAYFGTGYVARVNIKAFGTIAEVQASPAESSLVSDAQQP